MYTKESKFISYCLRHGADKVGLAINKSGWVKVEDLLAVSAKENYNITRDILEQIVADDSKGRYSFDDSKNNIRANQGHSMDVDLGLKKKVPPIILFHGTSSKYGELIKKSGIQKMNRTHVHLSDDVTTAMTVGKRHGQVVNIFCIDTKQMLKDGIDFYCSENGVWLVDFVDPKYFCGVMTVS